MAVVVPLPIVKFDFVTDMMLGELHSKSSKCVYVHIWVKTTNACYYSQNLLFSMGLEIVRTNTFTIIDICTGLLLHEVYTT